MIGSLTIILTWAYPIENRNKHGRILLLWLSVCDFFASLFYFVSTLGDNHDTAFCVSTSLLDIFFPVASFLWTDFIAYYFYLAVRSRSYSNPYNWKRVLLIFHIIAWSVSALVVIFVVSFDHAGRSSNDDNDDFANTTGVWCWIKANSPQETFIWEMIGGKFIEWLSALVIVPCLYISVGIQLYRIDQRQVFDIAVPTSHNDNSLPAFPIKKPGSSSNLSRQIVGVIQDDVVGEDEFVTSMTGKRIQEREDTKSLISDAPSTSTRSKVVNDGGAIRTIASSQTLNSMATSETTSKQPATIAAPTQRNLRTVNTQGEGDETENNFEFHQSSYGFSELNSEVFQSETSSEDLQYRDITAMSDRSSAYRVVMQRNIENSPRITNRASGNQGMFFSQFYYKLALTPLIFIFSRFWSSLRVILLYVDSPLANDPILRTMMSFCDPSQGFFNSLIFVLFSKHDRQNVITSLKDIICWVSCRCCTWYSGDGNPESASVRQQLLPSNPSITTELNIDDIENFETCSESNRLSDFSFG